MMRSKHYHRADVILGKCETTPALVESIQFHGIENTKNDALVKEIAPIYKSANVAELIHNCNLAAKHMQEIGLLDEATALVDASSDNPHGYIVNFLVKEPRPYSLGMKVYSD
ncbi:unnamed protein product [Dracunculus medinensis]|uniref:Pentatricopeptide repeat-containing protein n=1 Tax=Dracunculus medinensis TaxID=318479 RepID=A0A0N4U253_DRAME|nr:unnamed protein product [Dracunculus medinensis]